MGAIQWILAGSILGVLILAIAWKTMVPKRGREAEALRRLRERKANLFQLFFPKRLASVATVSFAGALTLGYYTATPVWLGLLEVGFWCSVATVIVYTARKNRFRDEVLLQGKRVCSACLYSLEGHGDSGRCPECGTEFTPDSIRKDWM